MKDINIRNIGTRIQMARTGKSLTQGQLAELIESDYRVISRIESGNQTCSIDFLIKIANALQVSVDSLLIDSLDFSDIAQEEPALYHLLKSCSKEEKEIIIKTVIAIKAVLDDYTIK